MFVHVKNYNKRLSYATDSAGRWSLRRSRSSKVTDSGTSRKPICDCLLVINSNWTTVPRTHNRFGDRRFAVAGPRLWNSLPIILRQISSYGQFRRYLKNHLFGIWEITAQCDAWFSALYSYSYLLTYLLTCLIFYSLQISALKVIWLH